MKGKLIRSFHDEYVPEEVKKIYYGFQLYKIIEKVNSFDVEEKNNFLKNVFYFFDSRSKKIDLEVILKNGFYGQNNYKTY